MALEVSELSQHHPSPASGGRSGDSGRIFPPPGDKRKQPHRWLGWLRSSRCGSNGDKNSRFDEGRRCSVISGEQWKPVFTTKVPINSCSEECPSLAMDSSRVIPGSSGLDFRPSLQLMNVGSSVRDPSRRERVVSEEPEKESEEGNFSDVTETARLVSSDSSELTSPKSSSSSRKTPNNKSPFLERATNKFSSPFRRFRSGENKTSTEMTLSSDDRKSLRFAREELLRLYVLKLDEEANYFKAYSPEDEFCNCPKCQNYYCEYYAQYLDEFERRRNLIGPVEASVLMDDMLSNGMTFCAIM